MADVYFADDLDDEVLVEEPVLDAGAGSGVGRLQKAALLDSVDGHLTDQQLAEIGAKVVEDWQNDKQANKCWREKAEAALDAAAQEPVEAKNYPFRGAANVKYPLLTISSLAFSSRAAPAIIKGDTAVHVKTFGKDRKGAKQERATRVADYLNWVLFYDVEGWERDTDAMLVRLPAVGQHYRKVYWDPLKGKPCIDSVSALRLTIPPDAPSLQASPRITHDFDRYPHEIQKLMRSGYWREVVLTQEGGENGSDDQAPRVILEQHRYMDLDEDGLDEPYIVTVDEATAQVLRIDEAWMDDGLDRDPDTEAVRAIERWVPFVDYGFIPDPKGRAYSIGFGHLLTPIMDVINTNINLMIDAGHAQVAGGGFVGNEVRLQGAGQNGALRWQPGEYKTVNASGDDIRKGIFERTFPAPSAVIFELLGLLMDAAKDIASVNEAITGDASRNAPVGTTLALIEQGQQVFNAIYKRIYRGLREEFKMLFDLVARYGDPEEYARFCDLDPPQMGHNGGPPMDAPAGLMAGPQGMLPAQPMTPQGPSAQELFEQDFNGGDLDIRPISDPSAVTRTQQIAKAQFILGLLPTGQVNPQVAVQRALEAGQVDGIEELMTMPPNPMAEVAQQIQMAMAQLDLEDRQATIAGKAANAELTQAKTAQVVDQTAGQSARATLAKTLSDIETAEVNQRKGLAQTAQIMAGAYATMNGPQGEGE